MRTDIIHLHTAAPAKPAPGAPCNGCGVCCALETCPAARLRFLRARGPCPALTWSPTAQRYHCGLLAGPRHLAWLPAKLRQRLATRWIAAGQGCDCEATVAGEKAPAPANDQ